MNISDDLLLTCIGMAISAIIAIFAFRRHFVKRDKIKLYRVPWILISLAAIATGFTLLVHLANIFGIETGRN